LRGGGVGNRARYSPKTGLLEAPNAPNRSWKGFHAFLWQEIVKKHEFCAFFSLQAIPLSRIIGLTKEEIEHFRVVLFFDTLRFGERMSSLLPNRREEIGRFTWLK
jgi:hypothetical protein